ncbi:hypothetical protein XELAEV_18012209mg [Xenopus laevis]|uniref:Uncharacterized protein n=1 Tax=Xenopus laevis TaxID=8355 RepID=A0A974HY60_XENLA|nr:hypothetical protein XELAEV_18012209mg [Xenopus laevis]
MSDGAFCYLNEIASHVVITCSKIPPLLATDLFKTVQLCNLAKLLFFILTQMALTHKSISTHATTAVPAKHWSTSQP